MSKSKWVILGLVMLLVFSTAVAGGAPPIQLTETKIVPCALVSAYLEHGWEPGAQYYAGSGQPWQCSITRLSTYGRIVELENRVYDLMGSGLVTMGTVAVDLADLYALIQALDDLANDLAEKEAW